MHIMNDLLKTGSNGKAAAIRALTIEDIEIADSVLIAIFEIAIGHGKLIEIAQHGQIQFFVVNHLEHLTKCCCMNRAYIIIHPFQKSNGTVDRMYFFRYIEIRN